MNLDGGLEDIRWIRGHGGLEDIRWIRGLGGEKLPASPYDFLPNLKKGLFFAIGEGSIFFVACFLHNSAQMCFYQTPGRRPPRITGRFVNTMTRGWVGIYSLYLSKMNIQGVYYVCCKSTSTR